MSSLHFSLERKKKREKKLKNTLGLDYPGMQSEKKEERKKEKIKTHRLALPCVIAKPL
jgi:hypothetical protein